MKLAPMIITAALLLSIGAAPSDAAPGRYERGRTLYHERCAQCFSLGWRWAPGGIDPARVDVLRLATTLSPEAVCTWQRQPRRPVKTRCRADAMTLGERIDVLYYLRSRLEGPKVKPRLAAIPRKRATGLSFRPRVPGMVQRAEARERLRRAREEFIRKVLKGRVGPGGKPAAPVSPQRGR